jgi:Domain of unknown function (DUF1844)
MADKKREESSFTVTDRRLFTSDGELRQEVAEESGPAKASPVPDVVQETAAPSEPMAAVPEPANIAGAVDDASERDLPTPPTTAEQKAQADAYRQSSKDLDSQVELSGRSAKEFEMTFERFLASLYMSAMLQMGMMHEQGQPPRVDIIGARQTIDTLSLLWEKTKGNLTPAEKNFMENSLYELRMAYVEVTNALARPPQPGPATGTTGR